MDRLRADGHEELVKVHGTPVGLATFEPGWRWSNDVRPLMGTDSCPLPVDQSMGGTR